MSKEQIKLLLIEDNPGDARLIQMMLAESRENLFDLETANMLSTGLKRLIQGGVQLVLLDLSLPDSLGLDTVIRTHTQVPEVSIVILTGLDDEKLALNALEIGAQDYLIKGEIDGRTLSRAIRYAIERKRAEEALRESNEKLQNIIRHSSSMFYTHAPDHELVYVSPQSRNILDCEPQDAMVRWQEFLSENPNNRLGIDATDRAIQTGERQPPYELELVTRKGRKIWVLVDESPVVREGKTIAIVGSITDITGRKQDEENIRKLSRFPAENPNPVMRFTSEGIIEYTNMASAALLATWNRREGEHVPPDLQHRFVELLDTGKLLELDFTTSEGSFFSAILAPIPSGNYINFYARDVTERRRAEAALHDSEESYRQLFEAESDAIFLIDNESGRILQANNAACILYGYSREELLAKKNTDLSNEPGQTWQITKEKQVIMDQIINIPLRFHRKADGTVFPVEITGRFFLHQGRPVHIAAIRDITARLQTEEALRANNDEIKVMSQQLWQAAKLATMGELAASVAHELNNPLATISVRTELLLGQLPPDDPKARPLRIVESEVKRMGTLVRNLLEFSRRSSPQISTVDVCAELTNTLDLIHYHLRKSNIHTVQECSPETPLAQVDRQQLRQVFLNLFTNAADAMPQGGTLTIRTVPGGKSNAANTSPLRLPASASLGLPVSNLPQVCIEISDTGEGIPPEMMEHVWEPFYTSKAEGKGTGLGMSICRRIIQEHGGTIELISEGVPGKGTTVRITLPSIKGR